MPRELKTVEMKANFAFTGPEGIGRSGAGNARGLITPGTKFFTTEARARTLSKGNPPIASRVFPDKKDEEKTEKEGIGKPPTDNVKLKDWLDSNTVDELLTALKEESPAVLQNVLNIEKTSKNRGTLTTAINSKLKG